MELDLKNISPLIPACFRSHLQDNYPLPNIQLTEEAKHLRDDLVRKREALTAGFFHLPSKENLGTLTARRDEVDRAVLQLYRILSPARNVSEGIWSKIFSHCLSDTSLPTVNFSEAPLLLTRVCRGWKSIAIKTPQLWSSVSVDIPSYEMRNKRSADWSDIGVSSRKAMLNDWLDRSGELPLTIAMSSRDVSDVVSHFIRRVELCSSRLHSLDLSISKLHFLYDGFLALRASKFPNLKEITVDKVPATIMQGKKSVPWVDAGIFCAPQLRRISIGKLPKDSVATTWSIPPNWHGLRYLHIGGRLPPRQILRILVTLPDLTDCHLKIGNSVDVVHHTTRILMPNLRSLSFSEEIDSAHATTSMFLYKYLDTPVLKMFTFSAQLSDRGARSKTINNPLLTLFPRMSAPTKLVLKLDEALYHRWSLETFLAVPFIKHLVLHLPPQSQLSEAKLCRYPESHKTLLESISPDLMLLNAGSQSITVLPKLQTLEFRGELDVMGDRFQEIILKRLDSTRRNLANLKNISATFSHPIADEISQNIRRHNKVAGIKCVVDLKDAKAQT